MVIKYHWNSLKILKNGLENDDMVCRKFKMTPLQKITANQKVAKMNKINKYYMDNPGCRINDAVTFIPESASLVMQYSKLRTELVIEGDQDAITTEDIHEYVYGEEPLRHRQRK